MGVRSDARDYMSLFEKGKLVYLTADSPNVLKSLDREKVYIIGGIVDHNRMKGCTYAKAQTQGIATARFPILEHCTIDKSASRVLTVNHTFDILLNFHATSSWPEAFLRGIPQRKGFRVKPISSITPTAVSGDISAYKGDTSGHTANDLGKTEGTESSVMANVGNDVLANAPHPSSGALGSHRQVTKRDCQVAVVTGGSSGVGLGFAESLVKHLPHPMDVLIVARNRRRLEHAADSLERLLSTRSGENLAVSEIKADENRRNATVSAQKSAAELSGGMGMNLDIDRKVFTFAGDLTSNTDLKSLRSFVTSRWKGVGVLVAAAGDFRWDTNATMKSAAVTTSSTSTASGIQTSCATASSTLPSQVLPPNASQRPAHDAHTRTSHTTF